MKNTYLLIFLLLISCASARVIESQGDKALKTQRLTRDSYYLGIAESGVDYDDALQKAMAQAQAMMINELGVDVRVITNTAERYFETNSGRTRRGAQWVEYWLSQEFQLQGEHTIKTKINRLYYEKTSDNRYKVWAELYFDIDEFYRQYHTFWQTELAAISRNSGDRDISATGMMVSSFERLLSLRGRFESERQYLAPQIVREYETLHTDFTNAINRLLNDLSVDNIANNHKFSRNFVLQFRLKSTNEIIPDLPITLNERIYHTDISGNIQFVADYEKPVIVHLGHNLRHFIDTQIYRNDTFSPYKNHNVSVSVQCSDQRLAQEFISILTHRDFKASQFSDITIDIIPTHSTKQISAVEFITELKLTLNIQRAGKAPMTIYFPQNRNDFITGYGNTPDNSLINSFTLEWHRQKDADLGLLESSIREILSDR